MQTGGLTPFPVSIPEGVSERCAVLLHTNDLSTENIYNEWCTLFTYIGVSDITDRECLQMCSRILLCPLFRSEQIRRYTDAGADEMDMGRVRTAALAAAMRVSRKHGEAIIDKDTYSNIVE